MSLWTTGERITQARLRNQELETIIVSTSATLVTTQFGAGTVELGITGSGDRFSYIDFHSSDGSDFDFRIIRSPGANSDATLQNMGNGKIVVSATSGVEIHGRMKSSPQTTYNSDGAAGAGGLVSGQIYWTSTGELRIKL